MAHKHLHELLKEDQEPFELKNYIADFKRTQKIPRTTLQVKKRKPIIESSNSGHTSLCKHACFFSFHDSPEVGKSPLFDFPSPAKSPCKSPKTVLMKVPAGTAALLLEAAMRIQKQSASGKPRTQMKNVGFGLFGSILKRLGNRSKTQKRGIDCGGVGVSGENFPGKCEKVQENVGALNYGGESGVLGEINEENWSLDLETSTSWMSVDYEERENGSFEKRFCSSRSSPFRFALTRSPSPGSRTPEFPSPAVSPCRSNKKEEENCGAESTQKVQLEGEEEEKEQCSPVSVLDPPFEDDEEDPRHESAEEEEEDDDYDLQCSYEIVERAKEQLLLKLRRFEKLAELDPIELEKIMLEGQDEENDDEGDESLSLCEEKSVDEYFNIAKEKREEIGLDDSEVVVKSVCKRFGSWKEVKSNTINMMAKLDFIREFDELKRNEEQLGETAMEIELAIFGLLVEELSQELVLLKNGSPLRNLFLSQSL